MNTQTIDPRAEKAVDYILAVTRKQGYLMDAKTLYGDGSRFGLTFKGFELAWESVKYALDKVNNQSTITN